MKNKTCCFTGHRPKYLPWKYNESGDDFNNFKEKLKSEIINAINDGYTNFISGMAMGLDLISAELVIELKSQYPNIRLECALPCTNQTFRWQKFYKDRYNEVLTKADKITFITNLPYKNGCMELRNQYMIDNSSRLIALFLNIPGGTFNTIKLALKKNLDIKFINLKNKNEGDLRWQENLKLNF